MPGDHCTVQLSIRCLVGLDATPDQQYREVLQKLHCISVGSDLSSLCCLMNLLVLLFWGRDWPIAPGILQCLPAQLQSPAEAKVVTPPAPPGGGTGCCDILKALIGFGATTDP